MLCVKALLATICSVPSLLIARVVNVRWEVGQRGMTPILGVVKALGPSRTFLLPPQLGTRSRPLRSSL